MPDGWGPTDFFAHVQHGTHQGELLRRAHDIARLSRRADVSIDIGARFGDEYNRALSGHRTITLQPTVMGGGRLCIFQAKQLDGRQCTNCGFMKLLHDGRANTPVGVCTSYNPPWTQPDGGFDSVYDYDKWDYAMSVFETWDGEDEPEGWIRHKPSNRRRVYNDEAGYDPDDYEEWVAE